jgi:hypothetical protein
MRLRPVPPDKPEKDPPPAAPSRHSLRVSQFFFQADFELKPDLPLFRDLEDLRDRIHKDLQLPSTSTVVYVYLFRDQERYQRFMGSKYPDLPDRRAFFVAQPRSVGGADELLVYTWWSERVQQDLRHELTHALLHSVLKDVPLWLDEGIAEYYEQPAEWKGVNYRHVEHLCRDPSIPDLPRLERLTGVEQMKPAEYRESWAWVHWMMHGNPKAREVLLGYLQQLRTNPNPGPLSARLGAEVPDMGGQLQKHLEKLGNRPPRGRTAQK